MIKTNNFKYLVKYTGIVMYRSQPAPFLFIILNKFQIKVISDITRERYK